MQAINQLVNLVCAAEIANRLQNRCVLEMESCSRNWISARANPEKRDLVRPTRIPSDWGLEVALLAEVFRNSAPKAIVNRSRCGWQ